MQGMTARLYVIVLYMYVPLNENVLLLKTLLIMTLICIYSNIICLWRQLELSEVKADGKKMVAAKIG